MLSDKRTRKGESTVEQEFREHQEEQELQQACNESIEEQSDRRSRIDSAKSDLHAMSKLSDPGGKVHSRNHHIQTDNVSSAQPITQQKHELEELSKLK